MLNKLITKVGFIYLIVVSLVLNLITLRSIDVTLEVESILINILRLLVYAYLIVLAIGLSNKINDFRLAAITLFSLTSVLSLAWILSEFIYRYDNPKNFLANILLASNLLILNLVSVYSFYLLNTHKVRESE